MQTLRNDFDIEHYSSLISNNSLAVPYYRRLNDIWVGIALVHSDKMTYGLLTLHAVSVNLSLAQDADDFWEDADNSLSV